MRVKILRLTRTWLWRPLEYVVLAAFKAVLVGAMFLVCGALMMRLMGYDTPSLHQLQEYLESVTRLSGILS
jgi:hypothetical protein